MTLTPATRRCVAAVLGTGLVLLLVVFASLDTLGGGAPERFVLTEVTTFEVPPPPPAPPPGRRSDSRAGGSTGAELTLETSQAPVRLDLMQLDVQFAAVEGPLSLGGLGQGFGVGIGDGVGDGSGAGFELVTLSELDHVPTVVSAPTFPFPAEATARGLTEFDLQYHVRVDEEGRSYPVALAANPFPALTPEFLEWASKVRFSPPTRLGIPVKAEYMWPVKIRR